MDTNKQSLHIKGFLSSHLLKGEERRVGVRGVIFTLSTVGLLRATAEAIHNGQSLSAKALSLSVIVVNNIDLTPPIVALCAYPKLITSFGSMEEASASAACSYITGGCYRGILYREKEKCLSQCSLEVSKRWRYIIIMI